MKRANFTNAKVRVKTSLTPADRLSYDVATKKLSMRGFEIIGIKKPLTVSDADMVGQPVFYDKMCIGTIMDQWDGHTLIDVNPSSSFIIDEYKSGQIRGKDLKIHLRG